MKDITRRFAIQGALTLTAGLLVPWGSARATSGLTKMDRILLVGLEHDASLDDIGNMIRIQVHPLVKPYMSLNHINGIEVEIINPARGAYYKADYLQPGAKRMRGTNRFFSPGKNIDEWIRDYSTEKWWLSPQLRKQYMRKQQP